jgi:L-iditol 2-dehydrogenase
MQAVVFPEPGQVEIRDVDRPEPAPGEALVRVEASTICGSDLKILAGEYPATSYPHIPGHEWAGEVVEVGPGVQRLEPGDRVAAEPHVGCGECPRCLEGLYNLCEHYGDESRGHAHIGFTTDGGLAEYVAVDTRALHVLPPSMSYDAGAFCETAGVALHAIERAGIDGGDDVVVVGPGAIGLAAVQIARSEGADTVVLTGTRESRLAPARDLGADVTVNVNEVDDVVDHVTDLLDGQGADLVVELAGSESASRQAVELARRGGSIVLAGSTSPGRQLAVDLREIVVGHKDIYGSVANPNWICERGLSMIARGQIDVDPLLTHRFALTEFETAMETFETRADGAFRVMLYPGRDPDELERTTAQREALAEGA